MMPKPNDYEGPGATYDFLPTIKSKGDVGQAFDYQSPNADVAGWIVARVSGKSSADLLSERVWSRIGTQRAGQYIIDAKGIAVAAGGFNAALGDMARLGQMMLDKGKVDGKQIVPAKAVENIANGGYQKTFAKSGYTQLQDWSYRSLWWHTASDAYAARGIYGQTIYVDPDADMVIVRFASYPKAANAANDPTTLPAFQAIANHLTGKSKD